MSQINVRNLSNENEDGAPDIVGVSTFSATSYMVPPVGTTAQRPENPQEGDLRFNTDTASLEYYRGEGINWAQIEMTSPDLDGGARGVFAGGHSPGYVNIIDYVTISALGNATDFGDLTSARGFLDSLGSRTRGIWAGGYTPVVNTMDYNTYSSTGNSADYGDLSYSSCRAAGTASSQVRGIYAGGDQNPGDRQTTNIDYITIAQTGNGVDFGNLSTATRLGTCGMIGSSVRGIFAGGYTNSPAATHFNTIEYVTIATTGDATDFGDLTNSVKTSAGASNSTRGLVCGGQSPTNTNVIQYITIASTGNATDFGDRTVALEQATGCSDPRRALFAGGNPYSDVIDYVQIATTGNAVDFGNLTDGRRGIAAASNAHGGL